MDLTQCPPPAVANQVNLVVATPCFGGQISVLYAASLFKLQQLIRSYSGLTLKVLFKDGDALITRARASLLSQFLDDEAATHLLFLDADIGFEAEQVLRLIQCGAEMCAAVYPVKRIDWDKVKETIETARPDPAAAALRYVFEVDDPSAVIERAGFVKVRYAGTGFLMMRRDAVERMCARYPQLHYKRDHSIDAATISDKRYRFVRVHDRRGRHLPQRRFRVLQALDRYGRRNLGRSEKRIEPCRPDDVSRRPIVAIRRLEHDPE